MSDKTGGDAFPTPENDRKDNTIYYHPGMTLLDYFAAKAMSAMIGDGPYKNLPATTIAELAYNMASKMITERRRHL
jgi:hypothetical protein